ncbi:hypothetical protein, partial [Hymenobacter lapidiphilus]
MNGWKSHHTAPKAPPRNVRPATVTPEPEGAAVAVVAPNRRTPARIACDQRPPAPPAPGFAAVPWPPGTWNDPDPPATVRVVCHGPPALARALEDTFTAWV